MQPSRPSPRVRPHPRAQERRFGQFVVVGSGRGDPPGFPLFALTGPRSTAPNVVFAIFSLPWLVTVGTGAGAAARSLRSRPDRVCHGPCSWTGYSPRSCTRRRTPGRVCPLTPVRVSDTRSKPFNQENSINGYQQQFKTRSGTQDRNRQGDCLGKRSRGITRHKVTFSRIYRDGEQWKTTQSFRFVNLLSVAKLADQADTLIAGRKAEAAPAAGDNESS